MPSRYSSLFRFHILGLFLAALLQSFSANGQKPSTATLTHQTNAYKVNYPANWRIDTTKKMGADCFLFAPADDAQDKFRENVNIAFQDISGYSLTLEQYAELSTNQIKQLATDGVIYESTTITSGPRPYHKIIYSMTQGVFALKLEQYYFIQNSQAVIVTLTCESNVFDKYQAIGESILRSFTLMP